MHLPIKKCALDLIVAFEVVEHLENPDLALREFHTCLKSGGFFSLNNALAEIAIGQLSWAMSVSDLEKLGKSTRISQIQNKNGYLQIPCAHIPNENA